VLTPEEEDQLLLDAIALAMETREDITAAHRIIRSLGRLQLEQMCTALALMVDPDVPLHDMAWWRNLAPQETS
jgi:hypothetical protein